MKSYFRVIRLEINVTLTNLCRRQLLLVLRCGSACDLGYVVQPFSNTLLLQLILKNWHNSHSRLNRSETVCCGRQQNSILYNRFHWYNPKSNAVYSEKPINFHWLYFSSCQWQDVMPRQVPAHYICLKSQAKSTLHEHGDDFTGHVLKNAVKCFSETRGPCQLAVSFVTRRVRPSSNDKFRPLAKMNFTSIEFVDEDEMSKTRQR